MKRIAILGSTGSIGCNTLDVVSRFPDRFKVVALSAGENGEALAGQAERFKPELVALSRESGVEALRQRCQGLPVEVLGGMEGLIQVATHPDVDLVVSAIVGSAGLIPTLAAIKAGKDIALANKETLVMAGELVTAEARKYKVRILPVDSEHTAIFQVIQGNRREDIKRLILTASGGPFLRRSLESLESVRPEEALKHPNWNMGTKITVDSATLMNKGLEVIEARWLFDIPVFQIDVLIHPQSIVHSMVEFTDGSVVAQLGQPDMRIPIAYSLSYPDRLDLPFPSLDLARVGSLTFEKPDVKSFPCLGYAYQALRTGGPLSAVLNAANEVAVRAFLESRIGFLEIPEVIEGVLNRVRPDEAFSTKGEDPLTGILHTDRWARESAEGIIRSGIGYTKPVTHS
ncbi:MAG: 1-deoxy-D-xylulose-5-phosphate reductoisomerase [Nitrospirae bacterium]|nr:1-deoxy-D-xylulose-5-phosphate reductoisomerase [Nitrospirota bacterium]